MVVPKPCEQCEVMLNPRRFKQRFCSTCAKQRILIYNRKRYHLNKAAILPKQRLYELSHRDQTNRNQRLWRRKNASRAKLISLRYREKNRVKLYRRMRAWRAKHPGIESVYAMRRWALKRNAPGRYSLEDWNRLKRLYDSCCAFCGKMQTVEELLTVDHKIPLSRGGTNFLDNLQPLCFICNVKKSTKVWFAFRFVDKSYPISKYASLSMVFTSDTGLIELKHQIN